jgi:hypothetical protein
MNPAPEKQHAHELIERLPDAQTASVFTTARLGSGNTAARALRWTMCLPSSISNRKISRSDGLFSQGIGKSLATREGLSTRDLGQICECLLQASCKFRIGASDFAEQAVHYDPESSQQFDDVELSD